MNKFTKTVFTSLFVTGVTLPAFAGDPGPIVETGKTAVVSLADEPCLWDASRPDSHAPIGVMGDHTHEAGEWMLGYQFMYMSMDGHRAGTDELSTHDVFDRGYGAAATEMEMYMSMFMLMYAPTDWLTLMGMVNYVEKDMQMESNPHAMAHGHGGHMGGTHSHSSSGLGDTSLGALIKVYDANCQRVHLNLSLVFPTAEVDEKQDGVYLPYGMQLGSGTWDLKPGITYLGQAGNVSWGAQALATFRLESENDAGFAYGNAADVSTWLAYRLTDWASLSGRAAYHYEEDIVGHYNGPHNHTAPPHFQQNYGGHFLDLGIGLNVKIPEGPLKGHRLGVEALFPVYQDANGVGMNREFMLVAGWQYAF